jgi:hypothetical protein
VAFVTTACRDSNSAGCLETINARSLLDHDSQLADEVGYLLEFGFVAMINRIREALNTLVVTDERNNRRI